MPVLDELNYLETKTLVEKLRKKKVRFSKSRNWRILILGEKNQILKPSLCYWLYRHLLSTFSIDDDDADDVFYHVMNKYV